MNLLSLQYRIKLKPAFHYTLVICFQIIEFTWPLLRYYIAKAEHLPTYTVGNLKVLCKYYEVHDISYERSPLKKTEGSQEHGTGVYTLFYGRDAEIDFKTQLIICLLMFYHTVTLDWLLSSR